MKESMRWGRLAAGTLMLLFLGLIYGWSIFKVPFSAIYPEWSISQISLTFTISMVCFCIGGFIAGQIIKKIGAAKVIWISAVLLAIGFVGVSFLDPKDSSGSLIKLYILYGVFCGTGVGMSYNSIVSVINGWFADKAGLASGILMMGFGLGGLILGSGAITIVGKIGVLATFKILGIAIAVVLIIGATFMKIPKEGEAPKKLAAGGQEAVVVDVAPGEMVKDGRFWLFMLWAVLMNSAGLLVINSAASIAIAFGAPAVMGLLVSLCNGGGRVVIGGLFDKLGRKITLIINCIVMIAAGVSLFLGATTSAVAFVLLGLLLVGVGYGGGPTMTSSFVLATFGPKNFPKNFSLAIFSIVPAAILGPMISSKLIEASNGDYTSTFILIIGLGVAALVTGIVVNKISRD
ncbi:MAG: MFS transporter [Anaerovoracaceae bacterium]